MPNCRNNADVVFGRIVFLSDGDQC
jgi:hypothetical protein